MIDIHLGDNLPILQSMPTASFDLIYVDPPFNTGKVQSRKTIRTVHDEQGGDRKGFMGKRYRTTELGTKEYNDAFDDFPQFLAPRLAEAPPRPPRPEPEQLTGQRQPVSCKAGPEPGTSDGR